MNSINPLCKDVEENSLKVYFKEGASGDFKSFFIAEIQFLFTIQPVARPVLVAAQILEDSERYCWESDSVHHKVRNVCQDILRDPIVEKFVESSEFLSFDQVKILKGDLQKRFDFALNLPSGTFIIEHFLLKRLCKDLNASIVA